jgi:hypothetical protein
MRKKVIILLQPNFPVDKVAEKLRSFGVLVERVMPLTRVVAGSVEASRMHGLKNLPEVKAVEEERHFQVEPVDD